ncbi:MULTISPECIES: helix-turn-helix domain-containing protein [unclassified Luteococcus]|uniref:helix-turn-helix domain-containing protein n=1 Tax=unclassified Luteococcus TaxID=2639923 RepID=UPI00313DC094
MTADLVIAEPVLEGEIVATPRERIEEIKALLIQAGDIAEVITQRIAEAQRDRLHEALGYASWAALVESELSGAGSQLTREEKRPLAVAMACSGASVRVIAEVLGISKSTVARDVGAIAPMEGSGVPNGTPEATSSTVPFGTAAAIQLVDGKDGKCYPRQSKPKRQPVDRGVKAGKMLDKIEKASTTIAQTIEAMKADPELVTYLGEIAGRMGDLSVAGEAATTQEPAEAPGSIADKLHAVTEHAGWMADDPNLPFELQEDAWRREALLTDLDDAARAISNLRFAIAPELAKPEHTATKPGPMRRSW